MMDTVTTRGMTMKEHDLHEGATKATLTLSRIFVRFDGAPQLMLFDDNDGGHWLGVAVDVGGDGYAVHCIKTPYDVLNRYLSNIIDLRDALINRPASDRGLVPDLYESDDMVRVIAAPETPEAWFPDSWFFASDHTEVDHAPRRACRSGRKPG